MASQEFNAEEKDINGAAWRYLPIFISNFNFTEAEICLLLGNMPIALFNEGIRSHNISLSKDELIRISLLMGIQSDLLTLFGGDKARAFGWIDKANKLEPFEGLTPRKYLTEGSFYELIQARKVLSSFL